MKVHLIKLASKITLKKYIKYNLHFNTHTKITMVWMMIVIVIIMVTITLLCSKYY